MYAGFGFPEEALLQFVIVAALLAPHSYGADRAPTTASSVSLCLYSVVHGEPTDADYGDPWRMVFKAKAISGMSRPVIYPLNRSRVWTIDDSNTYVPFEGDFP
jgi:hypothetical protein